MTLAEIDVVDVWCDVLVIAIYVSHNDFQLQENYVRDVYMMQPQRQKAKFVKYFMIII